MSYLKGWQKDMGGSQNGIHEMGMGWGGFLKGWYKDKAVCKIVFMRWGLGRGWGGSLKDKRIRRGFAANCKHNTTPTHTGPDCNHIMIIDHVTKRNHSYLKKTLYEDWIFTAYQATGSFAWHNLVIHLDFSTLLPQLTNWSTRHLKIVDEEVVGDNDDKEVGHKKEPKVAKPDLGFSLGSHKWDGFFVHINRFWVFFWCFQNPPKSISNCMSSVRIVFTHAELILFKELTSCSPQPVNSTLPAPPCAISHQGLISPIPG